MEGNTIIEMELLIPQNQKGQSDSNFIIQFQEIADIKSTDDDTTKRQKIFDSLNNDEKIINFFDILMEDWKFREKSVDFNYNLVAKDQDMSNVSAERGYLIRCLISLLKNGEKKIFHYAAYSILCQFIHEKQADADNKLLPNIPKDLDEFLKGVNDAYKDWIKLILIHYSHHINEELHFDESDDDMLVLLLYLRGSWYSKFEKKFKYLIEIGQKELGSYHKTILKPYAQFYYQIAKENAFPSFIELIFRLCPYVKENSCLVTSFYEQRKVMIFEYSNEEYGNKISKIVDRIVHYRLSRKLKELGLPDMKLRNFEALVKNCFMLIISNLFI